MKLRKEIEAKVLGLPDGIVKTDDGDLLVNTIGTKYVHVYNVHKKKYEKYTLKDFAGYTLNK